MKTLILVVTTLLTFQANAYTYTCEQVSDIVGKTVYSQSDIEYINKHLKDQESKVSDSRVMQCKVIRAAKENGLTNEKLFEMVAQSSKGAEDASTKSSVLLNASLSLN